MDFKVLRQLGTCEILIAKLWELYLDFHLAWRLRINKLVVESDSALIIYFDVAKVEH